MALQILDPDQFLDLQLNQADGSARTELNAREQ
jgi:hypothetical protein